MRLRYGPSVMEENQTIRKGDFENEKERNVVDDRTSLLGPGNIRSRDGFGKYADHYRNN